MNDLSVTVSAREFAIFLNAIQNVYRGGVSLTLYKDYIDALVISEDNASIMMYSKINRLDVGDESPYTIHIKDVGKFLLLMDMNNKAETFTFKIRKNAIYFENDKVRGAKFFIDENPARKMTNRISAEWFNQFEPHFSVVIDRTAIKEITTLARFASSSEKVYFYEKDNTIIAELNDRTKDNIDNISIKVADEYNGHINGNIILALNSLAAVVSGPEKVSLEVADIHKNNANEVLFVVVNLNGVFIKYLFPSKIK